MLFRWPDVAHVQFIPKKSELHDLALADIAIKAPYLIETS